MALRERSELARDLRWLAQQWRVADPMMKLKIQSAFRRGLRGVKFQGESNFG